MVAANRARPAALFASGHWKPGNVHTLRSSDEDAKSSISEQSIGVGQKGS
jgi:hypothetical protein